MSMFTKILQVSCLISSLLACTGPSREQSQHILPQKLPISYTPMELDSLYEPLYRDSFILQEKHDEFRHPVEQQFPMEQRLAHNTWILEFTWRIKYNRQNEASGTKGTKRTKPKLLRRNEAYA